MDCKLLFAVFAVFFLNYADCSFFGGTVKWRFLTQYESVSEVETSQTVFLSTDEVCSVGEWTCSAGCSGTLIVDDAATATCDVTSTHGGWKIAEYVERVNFTLDTTNIVQSSPRCCWTEIDGDIPDFGLSYSANVNPRSDTGSPNHPPQVVLDPLVRLRSGCVKVVDIRVTDDDGDDVRCRIGTNELECGSSNCGDYRYFSLDEGNCRLFYNAGGPGDVRYGIRIVIEDFAQATVQIGNATFGTDDVLSYVTAQFTVEVYSDDTTTCNHEPFFIDPTPPDGQTIAIANGATFSTTLYASPSNSEWSISEFVVLGASSAVISGVTSDDSNVYSATVQWSEAATGGGNHLLCFVAVDSQSHSSSQHCITLVVADSNDPCDVSNGGCSDRCVWDGSAPYICECFRSCWHLAADQRNCIPMFETTCGSDDITVTIPSCAVDELIALSDFDTASQDLTPNECRYSNNDTFYWFQFGFQDCSTTSEEDLLEIRYDNSIRMWVNPEGEEGSGSITRGQWYNVAIRCSYPKHGSVNGTFTPVEQEVNLLSVPGLGTFSFYFNFFSDVSFEYAYSPIEYPISYVLNSDIYFGIEARGGSNLDLFTETCEAKPVTQTDTTDTYEMIKNGCLEDDTMLNYDIDEQPLENRYSIKAFRFRDGLPNITANTNVYIECTVRLCVASDNTTRCYEGCVSSAEARKKRHSDEDLWDNENALGVAHTRSKRQQEVRQSDSHPVGGNNAIRIQVVISNNTVVVENDTPTDDGTQQTLIIIAASAGSVIFVLLVLTTVYVSYQSKKRKEMLAAIMPLNHPGTPPSGQWAIKVPPPYFEGDSVKRE